MDIFTFLIILFIVFPILGVLSIPLDSILGVCGAVCIVWGGLVAVGIDSNSATVKWVVFIFHAIIAIVLFVFAANCSGDKVLDLFF